MKGIEILTMTEIKEYPEIVTTIAGWLFVFLIIGIVMALIDNESAFGLIGAIIVIVTLVGFIFLFIKYPERPTGRYKYEAVIDEDVDIQDVYEKYKVIEKDGKKWILEDKED